MALRPFGWEEEILVQLEVKPFIWAIRELFLIPLDEGFGAYFLIRRYIQRAKLLKALPNLNPF